jgi:hypothetical protein
VKVLSSFVVVSQAMGVIALMALACPGLSRSFVESFEKKIYQQSGCGNRKNTMDH